MQSHTRSSEDSVKLIKTHVINIPQAFLFNTFNCDHKDAIVIVKVHAKTLLLTLHLIMTHWQPVLI